MIIRGNIPEEIIVISSAPYKINVDWNDFTYEEGEKPEGETVYPAFVTDASNEKTIETGMSWAENRAYTYEYNKTTKTHDRLKVAEVKRDLQPNKPFKGLRIISLEIRNEGGRAYKVVTKEGYYFDLREDVLLDIIKEVGIEKGGIPNGEYIWAKVGSQMKIIRVGSELYKALIIATQRGEKKKISLKQLVPGTVYRNKSGDYKVFLGFVSTEEWETEESHYGYNNYQKGEIAKVTPVKKTQLWFEPYNFLMKKDGDAQKLLDEALNDKTAYRFTIRSSSSVIEADGNISLPPDIVEKVKNLATKHAKSIISEELKRNSFISNYYMSSITGLSGLINMSPLDGFDLPTDAELISFRNEYVKK